MLISNKINMTDKVSLLTLKCPKDYKNATAKVEYSPWHFEDCRLKCRSMGNNNVDNNIKGYVLPQDRKLHLTNDISFNGT